MTSSACTVDRRTGISTSTPRRASLYARSPPILTADAAGIGSSISPRRRSSRSLSSSSLGGAWRSTTSPSGSPVEVGPVRSISVRYRLSRPTRDVASLVALPANSSSSPVANGSSVPACPVRAPVTLRICATTANEDGPRGLSTSATPAGSSARGGTLLEEAFADLLDGLCQRLIGGEAGGLTVSAPAEPTGDHRDVELVDARAERAFVRRRPLAQLLPDQHCQLGAFDGAQVVDDSLGVRLGSAGVRKIPADEVRDDDSPAFEHLGAVKSAREQLQLRELDGLVHLLKDGVDVRACLDELRRESERFRRRVRVLEPSGVGDERDVQRLRELGRELDPQLGEHVAQHLARGGGVGDDEVDVAEARVVVVVVDVEDERGERENGLVADPILLRAVDRQ